MPGIRPAVAVCAVSTRPLYCCFHTLEVHFDLVRCFFWGCTEMYFTRLLCSQGFPGDAQVLCC